MIPTVNLLPWRLEHQKRLNKRFALQLLAACLLAVLVSGLAGAILQLAASNQEQRNSLLQAAIDSSADTEGQFAHWQQSHQLWQAHLSLLGSLENERAQTARLLSQLAQVVPDQLRLSHLHRKGGQLHARGEAGASRAIAALVERMNSSDEWHGVELSGVRAVENGTSHFELRFRQGPP